MVTSTIADAAPTVSIEIILKHQFCHCHTNQVMSELWAQSHLKMIALCWEILKMWACHNPNNCPASSTFQCPCQSSDKELWTHDHHCCPDNQPALSDFEAAVLQLSHQSSDFIAVDSCSPQQLLMLPLQSASSPHCHANQVISKLWLVDTSTISLHWEILKLWACHYPNNHPASSHFEASATHCHLSNCYWSPSITISWIILKQWFCSCHTNQVISELWALIHLNNCPALRDFVAVGFPLPKNYPVLINFEEAALQLPCQWSDFNSVGSQPPHKLPLLSQAAVLPLSHQSSDFRAMGSLSPQWFPCIKHFFKLWPCLCPYNCPTSSIVEALA